MWTRRYDGPGHGLDQAQSVAAGPSGRVFVTGASASPSGGQDFATIAYRG